MELYMVQGGVTGTGYSEEFVKSIVKYIEDKPDLVNKMKELLKKESKIDESSKDLTAESIARLLSSNEGVLSKVIEHFTENHKDLEILLEQANKVKGMEEKLDALGNQLLIQGAIGGAALTTLIGVLTGSLVIGGMAGALIGGGAVLAGILAIVAIAAIVYTIYQYRSEIKGGAEYVGGKAEDIAKGIVHLLKNFIDKISPDLPYAVAYLTSFEASQVQAAYNDKGDPLPDDVAFIKQYLLNKDGFEALKKHIEKSVDKKVTLDGGTELKLEDLERLKEKGNSVFKNDLKEFKEELGKFKLLMNENSKNIRKQVEEKQDEIHKNKKLQTPLPSSALYPGSVANNEFLAAITKSDNRKNVKDLLQKVTGSGPELKGGLTVESRKSFFDILKESPYELDSSKLENLEKKGNEVEGEGLKELAEEFEKLNVSKIEEIEQKINKKVKEMKPSPELNNTNTEHAVKQEQKNL